MKSYKIITSVLDKIFGENSWVQDKVAVPPYFVAAGNPTAGIVSSSNNVRPESLVKFAGDDKGFIVAGNSMMPKGINNGDAVVCRRIEEGERKELETHKFYVIKVDKEWYEADRKSASFDYKLRYSVAQLPVDSDFGTVYDAVKDKEDSLLIPGNVKEFRRKYEEAVEYYGADTPLLLSLTFKEGRTHYSIHPAYLVEFEVIGHGCLQQDGNWKAVEIPAA